MTKQDIIIFSKAKVLEANLVLSTINEELEFYTQFSSAFNKLSSLDHLTEMSVLDLFLAYINARITDIDYSDMVGDIAEINDDLLILPEYDYYYIINIIKLIMNHPEKDKFMEALNDSNQKRKERLLKSIINADNSRIVGESIESLLIEEKNSVSGIIILLKYYNKYPEIMQEALDLIAAYKTFEVKMRCADNGFDKALAETSAKIKKKDAEKILNRVKKKAQNSPTILKIRDALDLISKYYNKISSEEKKTIKHYKKQKEIYANLINELNKIFNQEEIIDYEKIVKKIPDSEIRVGFLKLVYEHNIIYWQVIEGQYKELMNNSIVHYLALLKENNISKDEININKIMHNKYEDIALLISELKKFNIDKETLIYGLENSDLETIKFLEKYLDTNIISVKTIMNYMSLLKNGSKELQLLQKNSLVIDKYGLNPSIFMNNPNVILLNENLEGQFEILNEYGLLKLIKSGVDYSFLNKNLINLLDKIIELGYIDYVIDDINILNEENFDRLYVLKAIGEEIKNKEELLDILRTNSFIVPDSKLNDYIPNVVDYYEHDINVSFKTSQIEDINTYLVHDLYYNINGVILSKNRVLRNYYFNNDDKRMTLFQNMIKGSILNQKEIEIIKEELLSKVYKK